MVAVYRFCMEKARSWKGALLTLHRFLEKSLDLQLGQHKKKCESEQYRGSDDNDSSDIVQTGIAIHTHTFLADSMPHSRRQYGANLMKIK